jgi:hypothetical protein
MEVVFVHLGRKIPKHLVANFNSFLARFPELKVKLILSDSCKVPKSLSADHIYFDNSSLRDRLFVNVSHDLKFREEFWRKSIERILAVCEYQINNLESSILHLESDILVLPNFPFMDFERFNSIAWQNYNEDRDVASILFIPDNRSSAWLYEKLLEQISTNRTVTDMSALRAIRRDNPTVCHIIPNLPADIVLASNPEYFSAHLSNVKCEQTNGLFDSAQIGMWLLGMDPRNTYGVLRIHNRTILDSGEAPLDPSRLNYSIDNDGRLNAILEDGKTYPIFSLHVHSKELQIFKSDYARALMNYVKLGNAKKAPVSKFKLRVLLEMFIASVFSGNLINFFLGIPFVYRVRERIRYLRDRI